MGLVVRGIVLRSGRILFCHVAKSGLCSHNLSFFDGSVRHFKTAGEVRQARQDQSCVRAGIPCRLDMSVKAEAGVCNSESFGNRWFFFYWRTERRICVTDQYQQSDLLL